jgi:hypothetical protein
VLEHSLKPSRLCRLSGRNGGQFTTPTSKPDEMFPRITSLPWPLHVLSFQLISKLRMA